jgi:hypothetical protein
LGRKPMGEKRKRKRKRKNRARKTYVDLLDLAHLDLFEDKLGDPVALGDGIVDGGVVEEEDEEGAAVVSVDDARTGLDGVFGGYKREKEGDT